VDAPRLALVGLAGRVMHYAEVETGAAPRLRRLGSCDFEADAEAAVFADGASGGGDADALEALCAALAEVFAGIAPHRLVVTAHPTATTGFFTPLPSGMTAAARDEQLRQEAALLSDVPPTQPVRVHAAPIRAETGPGGDRTWYHVVHVAEPVHARLALLAQATGADGYDLTDTARAASALVGTPPGTTLVVGLYPAHTEVAVVTDGALAFGYHGAGHTPEDTAYYALAAADRVGATQADVARVAVYGSADDARTRLLAEMTGRPAEVLDPFAPFGRRFDVDPSTAAAFAPVLGAALR
jgi:hypothetical protein